MSKSSSSNASDRVVLEICQSRSSNKSKIRNLSKSSSSNASNRVVLEISQSLVVVMQVKESYEKSVKVAQ